MSEPTSPRPAAKPKAVKKPAARTSAVSKDAAAALKRAAEAPASLVSMVREARGTTDTVIEVIAESSALYEQETQVSLVAIRERLSDPGLAQDERLRLEAREAEMLDRLDQSGREKRTETRGAHQDLIRYIAGAGVLTAAVGVYAFGGKEAAKELVELASKVAPRAITS